MLFEVIQNKIGTAMTPMASGIHTIFYKSATWFGHLFMGVFSCPLLAIYLYGPSFMNIGFWNGKSSGEICTNISTLGPDFWSSRSNDCIDIILSRFEAFVFSLSSVFWCIILYILFRTAARTTKLLIFSETTTQIVRESVGLLGSIWSTLVRACRFVRSCEMISLKRRDPNTKLLSSPGQPST